MHPEEHYNLDQIREQLPKAHWGHGRILEDISIAIDGLHIRPRTFWEYDRDEQATYLAYFRYKRTVEAYEALLVDRKTNTK